jgi:hypothetical protein
MLGVGVCGTPRRDAKESVGLQVMEVRPYGQFSASVTNLRPAGATVFAPHFVNKPAPLGVGLRQANDAGSSFLPYLKNDPDIRDSASVTTSACLPIKWSAPRRGLQRGFPMMTFSRLTL